MTETTLPQPLAAEATPAYAAVWQRYEARKAAFLAANPSATPEQVEEACRRIAQEEGL